MFLVIIKIYKIKKFINDSFAYIGLCTNFIQNVEERFFELLKIFLRDIDSYLGFNFVNCLLFLDNKPILLYYLTLIYYSKNARNIDLFRFVQ
jgi:hypothetical protein